MTQSDLCFKKITMAAPLRIELYETKGKNKGDSWKMDASGLDLGGKETFFRFGERFKREYRRFISVFTKSLRMVV